jgi:hypothetical protein
MGDDQELSEAVVDMKRGKLFAKLTSEHRGGGPGTK